MKMSKEYQNAWYKKNRDKRILQIREYNKKQHQLFREYKATLFCKICNEKESCCLDFHHLDPTKKDASLGDAKRQNWSFKRLKREIDKCVVLCANCHRKVHAGIAQLAEQVSCKDKVEGSIPSPSTTV